MRMERITAEAAKVQIRTKQDEPIKSRRHSEQSAVPSAFYRLSPAIMPKTLISSVCNRPQDGIELAQRMDLIGGLEGLGLGKRHLEAVEPARGDPGCVPAADI